ncbi:hypothetical protein BDB01DRAFT_789678 [Pilobolus umbonatus]|nr:hypothetical protein BDB01DRAFT_789678 [Pilobolus umbonatus]
MFRFDSFKKPSSAHSTDTPVTKDSFSHDTSDTSPASFLKRIASTDTLRSSLSKRTTAKSALSSSFPIPIPTSSWGMLFLSRLQDTEESELDDIVELLLTGNKAVLLLPVSTPSLPSAVVDREFILDHTMFYTNSPEENQVVSLSGIRGVFQKDQYISLDVLSTRPDITAMMSNDYKKRLVFDSFNLDPASITPDHPSYTILASHVQLPLRENKQISVILIQKPISRSDIMQWMEQAHANTPHMDEPLSPWVEEFIKNYKKDPPKSRDQSGELFLSFMDDIEERMGYENDTKERLDRIESYVCQQLYEWFFTLPEGDEALQDEALESRIAALNLLDLDLRHLGVMIEDKDGEINEVVKSAGNKLQQLNYIMGAKEKADILVDTHKIIAAAMESFAQKHRDAALDSSSEVAQEINHVISSIKEDDRISSLNADILLPLLIYTIVKSNPTHFLSNLRFIQRYCRPHELSGQTSYCLTNMMAAVSFLETTNLVGLGLSPDKVYSHLTDLNAQNAQQEDKPASKTNTSGMKIMSDVVDSSYRVFDGIGKFWNRNTQDEGVSAIVGHVKSRVRKMSDVAESISKDGLNELREMTISSSHKTQEESSSWDTAFMDIRNKVSKQKPVHPDGPITKFIDMKSVEQLTIGEVTELLADYKRLAAILKQAGLA